jgi:dihydroorotate dehydrogenase
MNLLSLSSALMPVLRLIDAETAHGLALRGLQSGLAGRTISPDPPALAVRALGLAFDNPFGLAAGFDKDAQAVLPLMRLGFGFVETGTVTPLPQVGNPKPRVFRLTRHHAIINRLGFNNAGLDAYLENLKRLGARPARLGANVGINKDSADPERDYPALVAAVTPFADYVTINISSPNTPGLRDLQGQARLRAILQAVADRVPVRPPLLVKLAPDLAEEDLAAAVETAIACGIDGLIIGNTTVARPANLSGPNARQAGGLSGPPLFARSTEVLRMVARLSAGRLTLIGCGGLQSGADALAKIRAGASLLQLYTAFAYEGPALLPRLKAELLDAMRAQCFDTIAQARGTAV